MRCFVPLLACAALLPAADNLLRNGSFESSAQYWMTGGESVPVEGAPHGRQVLRFAGKGELRSHSFALQPGQTVTLALSGRSAAGARINGFLCPSNREVAKSAGLVWNDKAARRANLGAEWKRHEWSIAIPAVEFIQKPYSPAALCRQVRAVLDRK